MTSCSSGDDGGASTAPSTSSTTTVPPVFTDEECSDAAEAAVVPLQAFVDRYDDLSVEEWNALDPPPDVDGAQAEVIAIAQEAVDRGCNVPAMEERLAEAIDRLEGDSEVGRAIAAALRGDGPFFGPPEPVISTTVPRDRIPTTVTVEPGESIADLLTRLAPGSTIRFAAGTHRFSEPIVVDMDLRFEGAGRDRTTLSSSAEGVAIAFVGPGGFGLSDLTVEHTGDAEASVVLAIEGPVEIDGARIRGGAAGPDDAGGGHGVVFAFENLEGFPARNDAERAGLLRIVDTEVVDNEAAGVLVTGTAAPEIETSVIARNGGCGLCVTGDGAGTTVDSTIEANDIGVQISDAASPTLRGLRITSNVGVGISIDGDGSPSVTETAIEENGNIGLQVAGGAAPTIERNTIRKHGVGILIAGDGEFDVVENGVVDHEIGIQVGGSADVGVIDNTVWLTTTSAISFSESSTGAVRDNRIDRAVDVGIQAIGDAVVDVVGNVVENEGAVGLSFVDDAAGTATGNTFRGREVGVQVGGRATPDIADNDVVDSVAVGILFGDAASGRAAENRVSSAEAVGVLAGGTSSPTIEANAVARNAVGLVFRESSTATASGNTVDEHAVGVQIVDQAAPTLRANTVTNSLEAGVVFGGTAAGRFEENELETNGNISIQVGESARPTIIANVIRGQGVYGVLYRDTATGEFRDNLVDNFVFGIQVNGSAVPQLYDNRLEQIALTNIVYADNSGGEVRGNSCTESFSAGISVTAPADPNVGINDCTVSRSS